MANNYKTDIKKLVKDLERAGWRIEIGRSSHYKCWPPDKTKRMVVISLTPSDRRALQAIKHDLRHSGANI